MRKKIITLFAIIITTVPNFAHAITFVSDTLSDTGGVTLQSHTGQTGATWAKNSAMAGDDMVFTSTPANYLRNTGSAVAEVAYYASGLPNSANYYIQATVRKVGSSGTAYVAVNSRTDTSTINMYQGRYYTNNSGLERWEIYKRTPGGNALLGSYSQSLTIGQDYVMKLDVSGSTLTLYVDGVSRISATDSAISTAGKAGISGIVTTNVTDSNAVLIMNNFTAVDATGPLTAGTLSTTTVLHSTVGFSWPAATGGTSSYTYQLQRANDVSGSPGSYSNIGSSLSVSTTSDSTVSASTTYWYRIVVSDGNTTANSNALQITTRSTPVVVPINDTNIFYSPLNWYTSGTTYKRANSTGAYFKMGFTGTTLSLNVDTTGITDFSKLAYSIDGGSLVRQTMSTSSVIDLTPAPLSSGNHQIVVYVEGLGLTDRWAPIDFLKLLSINLDSGASTLAPTLKSKRMVIYSDSIGEGTIALGSANTVANTQWTTSWDKLIADQMDAEIGAIVYQGQGFTRAAPIGLTPALPSSYNYISSGISRTFSPEPDYVIIAEGTNDYASLGSVQSTVTTFISSIRTAMPNATIYILVPFNQTAKSQITAAFNSQSDPRIFLVDLGSSGNSTITSNSYDGTHPNVTGHSLLETAIYNALDTTAPTLSSISSGTPTTTVATTTWTSNEAATTQVEYGTTTSYGSLSTYSSSLVTSHSSTLSGLTPSTLYHYRVISIDASHNTSTSTDNTFTTASVATIPGAPTGVSATASNAQATITFTAPVSNGGSAITSYTVTSSPGGIASTSSSSPITVTNLTNGVSYTFTVTATNAIGTSTSSGASNSVIPDGTAPTISSISYNSVTNTSSYATWTTDENSSSKVDYGLSVLYGSSTSETDTVSRVTSHSVSLSGLNTCSLYHYRVRSKDSSLNESVSGDNVFVTSGCTGNSSVSSYTDSTITTSSGGNVSLSNTTLTVPTSFTSGSVSVVFQAKALDKTTFISSAGTPSGVVSVGSSIINLSAYTSANTVLSTFNSPLSVTMSYTSNDVSGITESSLRIYRYDSGSGWTVLNSCTVDTNLRTVTCQTSNFSDFALFGTASPSSSSTSHSFGRVSIETYNKVYGPVLISTKTLILTKNLKINSNDKEIKLIQQVLNRNGFKLADTGDGSPGNETTYFGLLTLKALQKFQLKYNIVSLPSDRGYGLIGPKTRAKLMELSKVW